MNDPRPTPRCPAAPLRHPVARCLLACLATLGSQMATQAAHAVTRPGEGDLTAMSLEQLVNIQVVGASKYEQKQNEVPAAVSVITQAEIQAHGWRTLDEALASLPGIYATYDRQYLYLGTRGFGIPGDYNTRVLLTLNGNRVNDPTYDSGPFGRHFPIDLALIERIEFMPGPGGAVYGQNAMFGVVNVITRDGADLGGAEASLARQGRQRSSEARLSWGRQLDSGWDVLLSASGLRGRGENHTLSYGESGAQGEATGQDGERDREWFARIGRGSWSLEHAEGRRRKDDPTGAYRSDPLVRGQYQGDRYSLTQLQYDGRWDDDRWQCSARLFHGREGYDSRLSYDGGWFTFPASSRWHGAELRLVSQAWAGHKLMLGWEGQANRRQEQHIQDLTDPANDIVIRREGFRVGLYAQDEWRLGDTLTATLGLRLDRNNSTGSHRNPRAALIWQADPATTLKALYGRAHRAPNAYERDYDDGFAQVGNPGLKGESIVTTELVADHRAGSDLGLRASLYHWEMSNLVTLGTIDPTSGVTQYQSGPRVRAQGLELSADRTWTGGARLRGSLAYQGAYQTGGSRLVNSPRLLGKLNASVPLPAWGLHAGLGWRHDGARQSLDGTRLGGHSVIDLNLLARSLLPATDVTFTLRNALDRRYQHPGADTSWQNALAQDGRSLRIELSTRF
ncbi:TonB-dependent receptor plug domain-containing protein [Sphaerotilus microaerophilus]|uniref:Ligand-gated channel protein n=1 Tax=Sphaerotilus microaerophilus TaxID=2914710 RepID=A0ABN6PFX0_9BURK|nr:TonB-dependent receptor [Sphaerotilus sp. FB-5]BDI03905.1 ligand-gated channel protein [Sphaerotilus sp. FB-5]